MSNWRIPTAILIAGLFIAGAILVTFRWDQTGPMRLDRWTGEVSLCLTQYRATGAAYLRCGDH